jgi:hypothetical protein
MREIFLALIAAFAIVITPVVTAWATDFFKTRRANIQERTRRREAAAAKMIRSSTDHEAALTKALENSERRELHWRQEANRWYQAAEYWREQAEGQATPGHRHGPPR